MFCDLLSADFFFKIIFFKKLFQEYHQSDNNLDPDQARQFYLGPSYLPRLSAIDISKQRVKLGVVLET